MQGWDRRFRKLFAALFALAMTVFLAPVQAAELIMFDRSGCIWCVRWEREIGAIYPLTPEGRFAPLRKISLDRGQPAGLSLAEPVFYTPTFVLMHEGREVGRITGYLGEDAFWGLLGKMVGRIGAKPDEAPAPRKVLADPAPIRDLALAGSARPEE